MRRIAWTTAGGAASATSAEIERQAQGIALACAALRAKRSGAAATRRGAAAGPGTEPGTANQSGAAATRRGEAAGPAAANQSGAAATRLDDGAQTAAHRVYYELSWSEGHAVMHIITQERREAAWWTAQAKETARVIRVTRHEVQRGWQETWKTETHSQWTARGGWETPTTVRKSLIDGAIRGLKR